MWVALQGICLGAVGSPPVLYGTVRRPAHQAPPAVGYPRNVSSSDRATEAASSPGSGAPFALVT